MTEMQHEAAVPEWDLADRMRKSLRHAGVDVQQIADYLGVSRTSVSAWINGRIRPSKRTLMLWAIRCGVPFSWLTEGTPDRAKAGARSGNLRFLTLLRAAA